MKKIIYTCCLDCGKKHGTKKKSVFGIWIDDCDMCGKKKVACASAPHDFGIYSNTKQKNRDFWQDLL